MHSDKELDRAHEQWLKKNQSDRIENPEKSSPHNFFSHFTNTVHETEEAPNSLFLTFF